MITTPPKDITVEYGTNATLQCVSDDTEDVLEWIKDGTSKIFISDSGTTDPAKYERVGTGTDYSIKIKQCQWAADTTDGGRYTCNPFGGDAKDAEVVVMGKEESYVMPKCYSINR